VDVMRVMVQAALHEALTLRPAPEGVKRVKA